MLDEGIRRAAIAEAAGRLGGARSSLTPCEPVRNLLGSAENAIGDAYEVQASNIGDRVDQGGRLVGRKIGLTSKAVQAQLGVDQPDYGTLLDDAAFADGEELPLGLLLQPRAEAEVALVLAHDLKGERPTLSELISSVAYVLPAIEIVDSRIAGWDITIVDTIADNASAGLFVLGASPKLLTDIDLAAVTVVLSRDGETVSTGVGSNCLGNPLSAALWLARRLAGLGQPLRAGDVVLTGALGPMAAAAPGSRWDARFPGLGSVSFSVGSAQ